MRDEIRNQQLLEDMLDGDLSFVEVQSRRRSSGKLVARLRVLWNERRFLSKIAGIGFLLSIVIALLIPKQYESTARLMPPDQQESGVAMMAASLLGRGSGGETGTGGGGGLGAIGSTLLGLKTTGDLFVGVLKSRTVMDDVITKFDLRKVYRVKRWEDARKMLSQRTDVSSDRKTGIISITVTDRDKQRAAAMAMEYVSELDSVMVRLNTGSAHRERVFLEQRLGQVQGDLETAEKDFSRFASKNTTLDLQAQGKAMMDAAASIGGELIATQTELEGLRQIYTDNNVRIRAAQARVDELRTQLGKLNGKEGGTDEQDPDSPYPSLRKLPVLGVTYADLMRKTKVEEAVFAALTEQYEMAKINEAKEIPSVKVLDTANIPEISSFPPRSAIVIAGTMCAAMLGVVWIFGTRRWEEIDVRAPGKALALEILDTIRVPRQLRGPNGINGLDGLKVGPGHNGSNGSNGTSQSIGSNGSGSYEQNRRV
jgi:capsule polysaccharide export protein KpsE/RkpR